MEAASNRSLAPSIRVLIDETADVLERIGSKPPHRNGASALYGRHLRKVLSTVTQTRENMVKSSTMQEIARYSDPPVPAMNQSQGIMSNHSYQPHPNSMQMMQFSAMSDGQITQAINDAGNELGDFMPDLQIDERSGLDWLDWFNMEVNIGV